MKICYLLESAALSGGVRIVFDQSRALQALGHRVIIRARQGAHQWYHHPVSIEYVEDLAQPFADHENPDVVVATFWTTVKSALSLGCPKTFHFCQGYEGDFAEYVSLRSAIEETYRAPIPKITLGPWLEKRLYHEYGDSLFPIHCVGQIVDVALFHPPRSNFFNLVRHWLGQPSIIMVVGMFEGVCKATHVALKAVELMRGKGARLHLIRVSPNQQHPEEEEITRIDEYYSAISPQRIAELYRRCDLFLAPSLEQEGFGLPFAEALASGVPAVATAIPSYLSFDQHHDYACFVPQNDPDAMAQTAHEVLQNRLLTKKLRQRGPEVVRKSFRAESVALRLEKVFGGVAGA